MNGKVVGRIAAVINKDHNKYYQESAGFFGYFESINSELVSHALLDKAYQWLVSQGAQRMLGPINLDTTHECGLLIEGFNRSPVLQMAYNPPYYQKLLEAYGLQKEIDLFAFYITEEITRDHRILNLLEKINQRNLKNSQLTFRTFDKKNFTSEIRHLRTLFNNFMSDNWGFVPASEAEFSFMADSLKFILIPELVMFAEVDKEVVGLSLALPDLNQVLKKLHGRLLPTGWITLLQNRKKIKDIRVLLMGVKKEYRNRGIESHFYLQTIKEGYKLGFTGAELSWVTEHNTILISILLKLKANLYKKYRIYNYNLRDE